MSATNPNCYLISGAGSGMGQHIARRLHARQHAVILVGRRLKALQATLPDNPPEPDPEVKQPSVSYFPLDHGDEEAVQSLADACPPLDGLVLCAGALCTGSVESTSIHDFDRMIHANLRGHWLMCHHLAKRLKKGASVVILGSNIGIRPIPDSAAYCVAKAGLHMLSQVLALEWAPRSIRCNIIAPGPVHTAMLEQRIQESPNPEHARSEIQGVNPMGRIGQANEITALVEYLLSNESRWTTGTVIPVDGGATAIM